MCVTTEYSDRTAATEQVGLKVTLQTLGREDYTGFLCPSTQVPGSGHDRFLKIIFNSSFSYYPRLPDST
jgi:hypothetical protein